MGVQEHYVSSARMAATAAWTVTAVLTVAGWGVMLLTPAHWQIGGALFGTAGVTVVVAGVMHTRIYVVKMCALIRRTGLVADTGSNVRSMV